MTKNATRFIVVKMSASTHRPNESIALRYANKETIPLDRKPGKRKTNIGTRSLSPLNGSIG